ncbi:DEP domain-containing protein DDB_G0279099 [Bactrocera dorsalis]|uniref:DEP domain-containing protein DDB_G0279099 n=1 Tax=Bactrocera dorsalis TaxID=27457 RepID=A0A6J0RP47_BACDO|nr:DEP domain-containing protein DDB_G0279099 [Bactrocera dorsalis]XP_019847194.2 DEP domain-containing protein DDB_G0279099 [Bactrocera dorsalis]
MAGIPPIPPLLCNTPPPIDFGEEDDDSGLPPTLTLEDEDDYGDFALGTDINEDTTNAEVSSLPRTPLQFELSSSTTSGFTDIPPALEDLGPISLNSSEFNNSTANQEVKTQAQLNEAFNYNVTQKLAVDSDHTETTAAEGELKPINSSDTLSAQEFVTDYKQLDFDANEAKVKTTICTPQNLPSSEIENLSEITTEQDSKEDSDVATKELEIEVKSDFMPTNSESPPPLPELVLLEDLADDSSDEECHRSPKKSPISPTSPLEDNVNNDSEDFFAIHLVNTPPSPKEGKFSTLADDINMNNSSNHNNNITNDLPKTENVNSNGPEEQDDDFGDFADFETASNFINPPDNSGLVTTDLITTSIVDSNQNMQDLIEPPTDTAITAEDDDDFDDFQNFSSAPVPIPTPTVVPSISAPNSLSITMEHNNNNAQSATLKTDGFEENGFEANSSDNNDDDDFGDFEEASYETPAIQFTATTPVVQTPTTTSTPTAANGNISDRLGTALKMMFPTEEASPADDDELKQAAKFINKINDTLPFEAIEAAKALEFQWPQSEMRHALIRSIGIDSRNILFGDNWNPSMPRFAANLSFNPLKPMKPQTTNAVPNTTFADADSMQYSINNSGSAAEADMSSYAKKTDVPDVEFDWQGAGLVNPLDGAKGETNARETEAVQPPPPVARLDTPDDEHQSHTTATNVGDNISETLSKNDNELTATPTRDACPSPLALDNAAYQFTTAESGINSISSSTSGSSISNSKPYDNSKTMTTLRLGANIVVDDDDETVVTSTYAGPLKETHIYTPSKTDVAITMKAGKATVGGNEPIDFDYEIAAAGIIIDEKVVKKEYRDVEYNPGFSLEMVAEYTSELPMGAPSTLGSEPSAVSVQIPAQQQTSDFDTDEFTEFTEFQSVPPPPKATVPAADTHFGTSLPASTITSKFPAVINAKTTLNTLPAVLPAAVSKTKEASNTPSRTSSPSLIDNMILSPAILLPQAIPISTNNTATSKTTPTIEWGDSTANINPDELARIEELFAQPKIPAAAKDANTSQKASPLHTYAEKHTKNNSISISASVALKEQDSTLNDDYWSEFVSVPVTPQLPSNASRLNNNNNNNNNSNNKSNNNNQLVITPKRITDVHINSANNSNNAMRSPRHQQPNINAQRTLTPTPQHKSTAHASVNSAHISARSNAYNSNSNTNSNSNDDDWSDFVSSTPTPTSAATQQQHVASYMPATHAPQFNSAAWQNANFYNNPLGLYHQQATMQTRTSPLTPQQQQLQLQQQIHIMQDFSTAPVTNRPQNALNNSNNANMNHMQQHSNTTYSPLQVGSARVAPSISLIPDLGFVAPALPVHTAFVNVLPKTSFNSKK